MNRIAIVFLVSVILCGCTEEQIRQAQQAASTAKQAVAAAETALAAAKQFAELTKSEQAQSAVAQAEGSLALARAAAERADSAVQAAAEAQGAGAGTLETLLAAAAAAGLPLAGWIGAWLRSRRLGRAFEQTVAGVEQARGIVGEQNWKGLVAPALQGAQDEDVRALVEAIQSRLRRTR
jgi:hypothetical protein